jgi:predicted nucleic acid-binding protein
MASAPILDVYLDTSVITAAIVQGSAHHRAAREYCDALVSSASRVYISRLVRIELLRAIRILAAVPENLPGSVRRRHRMGHWGNDIVVHEQWMRSGIERCEALPGDFIEMYELPLDYPDWDRVAELMAAFHLSSYDAVHVATAFEAGIHTIASVDADYTRVTSLNVVLVR